MPVEVVLNTPLADALNAAIQPKLVEVGWGTGGSDDSALAEYVILMLVNGKSQNEIAAELSGELLSLPPDDPGVVDFAKWLFEQIDLINAQINGGSGGAGSTGGESAAAEPMSDPPPEATLPGEMDTDMTANDVSGLNAPTGPRSMRNGNLRGGRDKRMLGHMHKAMDRSAEGALHRTRGNDRINTHGRTPPSGPRSGPGRLQRHNNINHRALGFQPGFVTGNPQGPFPMMNGPHPNQMELMAMLEHQSQMMFQLSQQMMNGGLPNAGLGQQRHGKSLFDRVSDPHGRNNARKEQVRHENTNAEKAMSGEAGEVQDVEMTGGGKREAPNPDETVCKYNLNCTNKECKFAHQSPVAPPGVSVDVSDTCSFGAACKNRKCVGRHPSPAARLAHQSEQDCKFFPNCQNPRCPFRHPSMPLCRNGPDCTTPSCRFTHIKTAKCKFDPCLNPGCVFSHEEGQQGGFKDKVWTPGYGLEHVSERKFVDESAAVEQVRPEASTAGEVEMKAGEAGDDGEATAG